MAENLQQSTEQQGPFSPLQTGCAFVMLTNMLIYLTVVAFTFNLLDPSKIDAGYLAKRGFTSLPEPKSEQDNVFQKIVRRKQQQRQVQDDPLITAQTVIKNESSPAFGLSKLEQRKLASSRPREQDLPDASLTKSWLRTGNPVHSRLYLVLIYPHNTLLNYSLINIYTPKPLVPENYELLSVEPAFGIRFPEFRPPSFDQPGPYLYTPPDPMSGTSRSGFKLSAPPVGAESFYTNETSKAKEPPPTEPLERDIP
jgi:hypothetical protein